MRERPRSRCLRCSGVCFGRPGTNIIGTRAGKDLYEYLRKRIGEDLTYYEDAQVICLRRKDVRKNHKGYVAVVHGTGPLESFGVAEEAAVIFQEILGNFPLGGWYMM